MNGGNLSIIEASRLEYTENKGEDAVHGILICEMGSEESNYCKNIFYINPYKPYKHRGPAN